MSDIRVVDLGGSIVAPDGIDTDFLVKFRSFILDWLEENPQAKLVFIIGGGHPARIYQQAYRTLCGEGDHQTQDWIGITATRLNAQFVSSIWGDVCSDTVVTDPTADLEFSGRILVASGWKPGFSTDNVSVLLAEKFRAGILYNLSNIAKVFSADPKKDPQAVPLDTISWDDYKKMCGDVWKPGVNTPFDPVATKKAAELNLKVFVADGHDLDNLKKLFDGKPFYGTVMGGD